MSKLDVEKARGLLQEFRFRELFAELGWSQASGKPEPFSVAGEPYDRARIAEIGGAVVFEVTRPDGTIPVDEKQAHKILAAVTEVVHENLLIFVDKERKSSFWVWGKRDGGKLILRPLYYQKGQPGDLFLPKLAALYVDFEELDDAGTLQVTEAARRLKEAFDVEKVTKAFFKEYERLHLEFVDLIKGIADDKDRRWYASILLNRLMFVYFLQAKGFLNRKDLKYLRVKLDESKARGKDRFFEEFLKPLFFEGFAKPAEERSQGVSKLLGEIKYLNGGLFLEHRIERDNPKIRIPDAAFENLLGLFDHYTWHLDDRPGKQDNEINPDVLGYIFEKYINQKAFGAYYTRPEITEYLCEQTLHRLILERVHAWPGNDQHFESIDQLLYRLDAPLCRALKDDILPTISVLDPACGSGAFLVAALKTLVNVYTGVLGKIEFLNHEPLKQWLAKMRTDHQSVAYFVKKQIITNNLFGVDIMEEATEIAKLRLFLALVSSVHHVEDLEPLPNIDFNILTGNSLVGLLHVDSAAFASKHGQGDIFGQAHYRERLAEKNRLIRRFREDAHIYGDDLRLLRDEIEKARAEALPALDGILLDQFVSHGIKYQQATWDLGKNHQGKPEKRGLSLEDMRKLQSFHWGYEFDRVMAEGGFDVVLANPPWEVLQTDEKEFFQRFDSSIAKKKLRIEDWRRLRRRLVANSEILDAWLEHASRLPHTAAYLKRSPSFRHHAAVTGAKKVPAKINLYSYFLEQAFNLLKSGGECGIVLPGGIYSDRGAAPVREMLFQETALHGLIGFENRRNIFEGVHRNFKIVVATFQKGSKTTRFPVAFMRQELTDLRDFPAHVGRTITVDSIRAASPEWKAIPEVASDVDDALMSKFSRYAPIAQSQDVAWSLKWTTGANMSTAPFSTKAGTGLVPVLEGKTIAAFESFPGDVKYWIDRDRAAAGQARRGQPRTQATMISPRLALRKLSRNVDMRTCIATVLPRDVFASDSLLLARPGGHEPIHEIFLCGLLNSFAVDWWVRRRVSANLNVFRMDELPVPRLGPSDALFDRICNLTSRLLVPTLLASEDSARPAIEAADRERLTAELDALVAILYGIDGTELQHLLSTFDSVDAAVKQQTLNLFRGLSPGTASAELATILLGGEGRNAEFKSTLRWDLKTKAKNPALETVVLKTLAGFLNSENGGSLVVGVDDTGKSVGLEHDYQTLQKKDRDGFGLFLSDLIFGHFGKHLSSFLTWHFHQLDDKDVCRIEIQPSPKPVYVKENQDENFYLRIGNSTRKLNHKEFKEYIEHRFAPKPAAKSDEAREGPPLAQLAPPKVTDGGKAASEALAMSPLFKVSGRESGGDKAKKPSKSEAEEDPEPRRTIHDIGRDESLCKIREVFASDEARDGLEREDALRRLVAALGFERLGPAIREELQKDLLTAAKRRIVVSDRGLLRLASRTISDYSIDELKGQLVAAVGNTWTDREEAIRLAARRLGFQRAGSRIQDAFKSAINGALRNRRIEANGAQIRRLSQQIDS